MATTRYFKEDVRAVGLSGATTGPTTTDANGNRTWTTTADGGYAEVKWKDGTIEVQRHPPAGTLKTGSKITKLAAGGYEIEEVT